MPDDGVEHVKLFPCERDRFFSPPDLAAGGVKTKRAKFVQLEHIASLEALQ